jgi:hypothetical protein
MRIIKNKIMEKLIEKLETYKSPKKIINVELNNLIYYICPDIILYDDIIIRKGYKGEINKDYIIKTFGSISAYEDFEFHTHLVDIFDCSLMQSLKYGMVFKNIIKNKLKSEFPNENFIIILECDGKNKVNTIIRFHKFRNNKNEILYDQETIDQFNYGKYSCGFLIEKI